jgi:hypothetical protein
LFFPETFLPFFVPQVQNLDDLLNTPAIGCEDNEALQQAVRVLNEYLEEFDDIESFAACEPIQAVYQSTMYDGFCGEFVDGVFWLWFAKIIAATFLCLSVFMASLAWWHFECLAKHEAAAGESRAPLLGDDQQFGQTVIVLNPEDIEVEGVALNSENPVAMQEATNIGLPSRFASSNSAYATQNDSSGNSAFTTSSSSTTNSVHVDAYVPVDPPKRAVDSVTV